MLGTTLTVSVLLGFHSQQTFHSLEVEPNAEIDFDSAAAIPLRLGEGIGKLTQDIVVGLRAPTDVWLVEEQPGFVEGRASELVDGLYVARFATPMQALGAANALYRSSQVDYAHPDFLLAKPVRERQPEGEPYFDQSWHLQNTGQGGGAIGADISAVRAWSQTLGSNEVIVAVIDSGFETSHADLASAWAVNENEIAGNRLDDDGNGFVDDTLGWSFKTNSSDHLGTFASHGTSVAGLIGARINGRGSAGVCPNCRILPVSYGNLSTPSTDAEAIAYAAKMGAAIISNSWGYAIGTTTTDVVVRAIDTAVSSGRDGLGTVVLFAMNNRNRDDCIGVAPDISSLDAVVAVSGVDDRGQKVTESAWGSCMDILGPTQSATRPGIVTTDLSGPRGYNTGRRDLADMDFTKEFSGTSAATPIVAGTIGLMLSVRPDLTVAEIKQILYSTADKVAPEAALYDASGFSKTHGHGRVNAGAAVERALAWP